MTTRWQLINGDCREQMRLLPDCSIDAIVTDPPYELGFMGKAWDSTGIAYQVDVWRECLRVLKHGGHLLAFGGSRTYHRLACAVEDAGFQIRDQIMWVYGSGFPKSLDVSKAIDKAAGVAFNAAPAGGVGFMNADDDGWNKTHNRLTREGESTDDAKRWQGWGTALKPAHEPIVLARKPLDGTVAQNVLWYGTGALNIDGCRVGAEERFNSFAGNKHSGFTSADERTDSGKGLFAGKVNGGNTVAGRFPANFIHDGSDEVLELFPDSKGGAYPAKRGQAVNTAFASGQETEGGFRKMGDDGSAARFFYCAKASKTDRNEGLDGLPEGERIYMGSSGRTLRDGVWVETNSEPQKRANHHPTVKPTSLMRYLIRLVTPPDGTVLDPFTGSGSTGKAAILEGFRFVGIEQDADYVRIADARIRYADLHR
jgi:DNA modification methylase